MHAMDAPRLLHRDSSHGYTETPYMAMPDEPEAIAEDEQAVLSLRARTSFATERKQENDRRDRQVWGQRLRRAEMRAADLGVDVFRQQAAIRQAVLEMERVTEQAA